MFEDDQMLDRIQSAARDYASRAITRGEALEEIIASLEAGGRDVFGPRSAGGRAEARSWAPNKGAPAVQADAPVADKRARRRPGGEPPAERPHA